MGISEMYKHDNRVISSIKFVIFIGVILVVGSWLLAIIGWIVGYLIDPNILIFVSSILGSGMIAQMVQGSIMKASSGGLFARFRKEPKPAEVPEEPKPATKPRSRPTATKQPPSLRSNFGLTVDDLHCNDAQKTPVPNDLRQNAERLINNLAIIWDAAGRKSIKITSAYRSPQHNKKVGGAKQSYHMKAMAVDFRIEGMKPSQVRDLIVKLIDAGRITPGGYYCMSTFTHYDIRGTKLAIKRR